MEPSIYDLTVDILVDRQRLVKDELRKRFRKTKPFRMKPMSSDEALDEYMNLTPDKMKQLIDTHGEDEVGQMIMEFEQLKEKKYAR